MICGKLVFYKDAKAIRRVRIDFPTYDANWISRCQKKYTHSTNIKINSKGIIDLNIRPNTIKLLKENRKKSL